MILAVYRRKTADKAKPKIFAGKDVIIMTENLLYGGNARGSD